MRALSLKIKTYQSEFSLLPRYVFAKRIFWIVVLFSILIIGSLVFNAIHVIFFKSYDYTHIVYISLGAEVLFLFPGFMQVILEVHKERYKILKPDQKLKTPRVILTNINRAKYKRVSEVFNYSGSYNALAKGLIEQWEWQRKIKQYAGVTSVEKAKRFFKLPSGSNVATYLAGILAIFAGIVVALIDKDALYQGLPNIWPDFLSIFYALVTVFVVPMALCIIPVAMIIDGIKSTSFIAAEKVNSEFLSQARFYSFIDELLELEDQKEKSPFGKKKKFKGYWIMRILMEPMKDIPKNLRLAFRAKKLSKFTRHKI